jgi:hypothetical protein
LKIPYREDGGCAPAWPFFIFHHALNDKYKLTGLTVG